MSPEEKNRFETLEKLVQSLLRVENVSFIENGKRRIAAPVLGDGVQKFSTGSTAGVLKAVSESGASSYNVAQAFNGTITIEDATGNRYKLGYYTA